MHFFTLWLQYLLLALVASMATSMTRRHRNSRVDFTDDERNFLNLPANDGDRNNYNSHSQDEGNKSLSEGQQSQNDDVIVDDADSSNSDDDDSDDQDEAVDPCEIKKCHRGRECHVARDGQAVCVCQRYCKKHRKLVCGTDGNLYLNHCQLHRAACLTGHSISIDRKNTCLKRKDFESLLQKAGGDLPKNSRVERVDKTFSGSSTVTLRTRVDDAQVVSTPLSSSSSSSWDWNKKDEDSSMMALDGRIQQQQQDPPCTIQEYELLKDNLLLYSHAKLMDHDDEKKKNEVSDKEYLVSIMFSHYDQNNNGMLEKAELGSVARSEHLDQLSSVCLLSDLVTFDDSDHDGKLNINEFYAAFSKLYSVSMVSLDKALETNHVIAHVGDNVEIKCDVTGSPLPPIIWRRNDVDLSTIIEDDIKVFVDGTLYLTRVQLVHAGNYTCHAQRNKDVVQTHVLHVETMPQVRVTPKIQSLKPGIEAKMDCHATGVPLPTVQWLKNDEDLKMSNQKYTVIGSGTELVVKKLKYSDTGAYMCVASNSAGSIRDISSLVVQDDPSPSGSPTEEKRFFVFHDYGVAVYEPTTCRLYHQIQGTDIIPGTQEYVCGDKGVNCSWGRAINVADRYVYVSQPVKDRVLIISKVQMVVVDVVVTDKFPVDLHYIPHLDQVWLLCWRASEDKGTNTIQIIRDASQKKKHHTVHPEPVDGQFDLVSNLFVPDAQDTGHKFRYGYAVHTNQRGMYKVDLAAMKYVRSVDLTPYNCVPNSAGFSSIGGLVVLECTEPITGRETGQLLLDYTTDSVISHKPLILGSPRVSPDSRNVVTVHRRNGSVTIVAQETTESGGLRFLFDVKTTLNISDATFYPSRTSHGYDLYASAVDKEDILFVNLVDGKVEMITGVGKAMPPSLTQWFNVNRPITSSGVFGNYMVTPAEEALFVVNGQTRTVNCEIGNLPHPRLVVWVTATL